MNLPVPEGAACADHAERTAVVRCPLCERPVCLACWHPVVSRCYGCLLREPHDAAPPVPWEHPRLGFGARLLETLATALHPMRTAAGFSYGRLPPAVRFALLTMLPLALLRGVIPLTQTLSFGGSFAVSVHVGATPGEIALDVLRAMGLSALLATVSLAALYFPYVSLCRAYAATGRAVPPRVGRPSMAPVAAPEGFVGGPESRRLAAGRMLLYRGFLLTLSMQSVVFWLAVWAAPDTWAEAVVRFVLALELIPMLLLFVSMLSTARLVYGVGPFAALVVVVVPLAVLVVSQMLLASALAPFMSGPVVGPDGPITGPRPAPPPAARTL